MRLMGHVARGGGDKCLQSFGGENPKVINNGHRGSNCTAVLLLRQVSAPQGRYQGP